MKIAVVGAGVGGLAAAYDLARAGQQVVVYEAQDVVGGLAAGFKTPEWDWSVEKYYHHWFQGDEAVLGLIDELGQSDKVLFPWPMTAAYYQGKFYPLDAPLSSLFPRFSWVDKLPLADLISRTLRVLMYPPLTKLQALRAGLVGFYLTLTSNWKPLETVTAHEWLRAKMGQRVYEILWEPMLISKFGKHYREVNMAWFWARVKARTPRLGTFEGGFQAFAEILASAVRSEGAAIRLNQPVERIEPSPEGGLMVTAAGESQHYDQVLVTTSPGLLARLTPDLPASYLAGLRALKSMGAVVLIMELNHKLSTQGVYWHNLPKEAGFPFLALVEHTNYVSSQHFNKKHIVYCGDYLDPEHEYFSLSKEELLDRFLPSLSKFNPDFKPDWIERTWMFRTAYAQPVPPVNHSESIPDLKTPIPGLWLASMSQVYPWDRGTNFAVEIGRQAAGLMLEA
ncbi:MAG: NAD(P)/FAD-dependent oxidoreductase, partial [Anaerolineales bacterium]